MTETTPEEARTLVQDNSGYRLVAGRWQSTTRAMEFESEHDAKAYIAYIQDDVRNWISRLTVEQRAVEIVTARGTLATMASSSKQCICRCELPGEGQSPGLCRCYNISLVKWMWNIASLTACGENDGVIGIAMGSK